MLLVTHNVIEAERSVDRLAILDRGRVIAQGTPAELKDGIVHDLRLELVLEAGAVAPPPAAFVRRYLPNGSRAIATVPATQAGEAVAWAQSLRGDGVVEEFSLAPATLEDVYIELVGRADALANGEATDALAA